MQPLRARLLRPAAQCLLRVPRARQQHTVAAPRAAPFASGDAFPPALLASALAASALLAPCCETEAPPPPSASHEWPQVLRALRSSQRARSAAAFTATRCRIPHTQTWSFSLDFSVPPSTDLYAVLQIFATALQGANPAEAPQLHVDESPTRTVLRLCAVGRFEVAVCVPRLTPFDTRVVVEFTKAGGPDAQFSQREVDAVLNAFQLMQELPGYPARVPVDDRSSLLDGKDSVDIGPPPILDRSKVHPKAHPKVHVRRDDGELRIGPFEGFEGEDVLGDGGESGLDDDVARRAKSKLEELGVDVFDGRDSTLTWEALAGYDEVKQQIENTLTLPLRHPDVYENIVRGTRKRFESNLPKAVLYEGPPGCGKTLSAKILSVSIGIPFVHVPLETILSKFYGETTRKLAEILQTANDLGPCLVFIDECDSIGLSRSSSTEIHEVTRRTLSVLLRHIDGMDGPQNTILLAATNHKEDIDPALMSRFDVVVSFPLPDLATREAVLSLYAKHLSKEELRKVAELSCGFSGRELLDICEEAERTYAGHLVRESTAKDNAKDGEQQLPRLSEYVDAVKRKSPHVVGRNHMQYIRNKEGAKESGTQAMTVGPTPSVAV